jgi:hypothetical protein
MNCSQLKGVAMGVKYHLLMCKFKKAYSLKNSALYIEKSEGCITRL